MMDGQWVYGKIAVLPVKYNKIMGMEQKSNMELLHFLKKFGAPVLTLLIIGAIVQIEQKRKESIKDIVETLRSWDS